VAVEQRPARAGPESQLESAGPLTQQEFLRAIAAEIGAQAPRLHVPYRALYTAGYAFERLSAITRSQRQPLLTRLGVNVFGTSNRHAIDKARKELGYAPQVSLHEGVRLTGSWYRTLES